MRGAAFGGVFAVSGRSPAHRAPSLLTAAVNKQAARVPERTCSLQRCPPSQLAQLAGSARLLAQLVTGDSVGGSGGDRLVARLMTQVVTRLVARLVAQVVCDW